VPTPVRNHSLKRLLGLSGWFQRFIPGCDDDFADRRARSFPRSSTIFISTIGREPTEGLPHPPTGSCKWPASTRGPPPS
jgi:hypothetical protein